MSRLRLQTVTGFMSTGSGRVGCRMKTSTMICGIKKLLRLHSCGNGFMRSLTAAGVNSSGAIRPNFCQIRHSDNCVTPSPESRLSLCCIPPMTRSITMPPSSLTSSKSSPTDKKTKKRTDILDSLWWSVLINY